MIVEQAPLVNKYVSLPKELAGLNCAAYVGGIVKGILDGADFVCIVLGRSIDRCSLLPTRCHDTNLHTQRDAITRPRNE